MAMKKIFVFIVLAMLNLVLFFVLQIIGQFARFFIYGESASADKYTIWVSLAFVIIHMAILMALLWRRIIIKSTALYIVTTVSVIAMFIYMNFTLDR